MLVRCPGTTGHGSLLLPDTAGEKVRIIIEHFMDFREQEKKKLDSDPSLTVGDVTTVNLTQLKVIMTVTHTQSFMVSCCVSLSFNFLDKHSEPKMGKEFWSVLKLTFVWL
jgi:hypothetical protein